MKSMNWIKVYELDGSEVFIHQEHEPMIVVKSHWNRKALVVLEIIPNHHKYTVDADELIRAIQNAQRAHA